MSLLALVLIVYLLGALAFTTFRDAQGHPPEPWGLTFGYALCWGMILPLAIGTAAWDTWQDMSQKRQERQERQPYE